MKNIVVITMHFISWKFMEIIGWVMQFFKNVYKFYGILSRYSALSCRTVSDIQQDKG